MNIDDLLAKETRRLDDIDNNEELQPSPVSSTFISFKKPQALLQPRGETYCYIFNFLASTLLPNFFCVRLRTLPFQLLYKRIQSDTARDWVRNRINVEAKDEPRIEIA